jgi:hypothetical protein
MVELQRLLDPGSRAHSNTDSLRGQFIRVLLVKTDSYLSFLMAKEGTAYCVTPIRQFY